MIVRYQVQLLLGGHFYRTWHDYGEELDSMEAARALAKEYCGRVLERTYVREEEREVLHYRGLPDRDARTEQGWKDIGLYEEDE